MCSYDNGKYVGSITDDSVITCDEFIYTAKTILTKTVPTKSNSKNVYILLVFLLVTTALLIAVSIYCYLIKSQAKEKHLSPYHVTTNELKLSITTNYVENIN